MSSAVHHLVVVPVILPLAAGGLMLFLSERRHRLKAGISLTAALLLLASAVALTLNTNELRIFAYALGDWPAPFGIVLVADQLSAFMVLLAAILGVTALVFSLARWHRVGAHFHSLVQFLLAGLNGAFLTGDLFNLFVFFELLLVASYGLALHGSGNLRVRTSLHYIVINLAASLLFLVGVSLMYGIAGTLNMADLAVELPRIAAEDRALLEIGAAMLGIAFLVKAGMWPLGFWLPGTYAAASAPAAALFSILSKVGIYAVVRVWFIVFGGQSGAEFLVYGGMATLVFAMIGMLSSQDLGRIASFSLLASSGTLLATIGLGTSMAVAAAFYYIAASTLGVAALFLVIELMERSRAPAANLLAVTAEEFGIFGEDDEPGEPAGVAIRGTMALLGLAFACAALLVAGLPPLPGFVAKFAILAALLQADPVPPAVWTLLALIVASGLVAIIALARAGMRVFWSEGRDAPRLTAVEVVPPGALLAACIILTIAAGPVMQYMEQAAHALYTRSYYIEEVLPAP